MDCTEEIENLTGRMSAKALGAELRLSLARDRRTLSELNKTPARDGSDSAWLCGVRAINPADKSHPASKAYDVWPRLAPQYYGIALFMYLNATVLSFRLRFSA